MAIQKFQNLKNTKNHYLILLKWIPLFHRHIPRDIKYLYRNVRIRKNAFDVYRKEASSKKNER
jgi:hypothetical protein